MTLPAALRARWALPAALLAYWLLTLALATQAAGRCGGRLVYPLDDTYIHMAMAKNAALHGVWGVTRFGFSSCTSSPLWTALLALAYALFGVNESAPLLLNLAFGSLALAAAHAFLADLGGNQPRTLLVLLLLALVTPLPALTFLGMEHTLHLLLTLLLLRLALRRLDAPASSPAGAALPLAAALLTASRYEGLFLAFVLCVLSCARRRWRDAALLGAAALAPPALYGLWSVSNGWFFLPNSILLKVPGDSLAPLFPPRFVRELLAHPHLLLLLGLALVPSPGRSRPGGEGAAPARPLRLAAPVFAATLILHLQFARTGWLYRYEAYLVALGWLAAAARLPDPLPSPAALLPRRAAARLLLAALLAATVHQVAARGVLPFLQAGFASANIHGQHYQMGLFARERCAGRTVAANDIGALCFLSDVRLLDLWGLASMETARLRLAGAYRGETMAEEARKAGACLAMAHAALFEFEWMGGPPPAWTKVGEWRIRDNVVSASDTVRFYAIPPEPAAEWAGRLAGFARGLPPGATAAAP